jgi:hypothetical protein
VIDREGELELELQAMTEDRDLWRRLSRKHEGRAKRYLRSLQAVAAVLAASTYERKTK